MTDTPARQPQHCDHECVCELFGQNCFTGGVPCSEPCKHDTRATHTIPPAPATGYCIHSRVCRSSNSEPCKDTKCPEYFSGDWSRLHNAQAAKAASEEAQQRINAVIKELEHLRDGQYNDVVGHNVRYAYDYAIILLRAQQAGEP